MQQFEKLIKEYQDYLTFYHECRVPKHPFFDVSTNQSKEQMLVVSSPSRMGNHLLMSMLDGHPELPAVPGEDGFHMFSFIRANYDIRTFLDQLRGENNVEAMMQIASNGGGSKWRQFAASGDDQSKLDAFGYSGLGKREHSAVVDFEGTSFPINFDAYERYLSQHSKSLRVSSTYNEVLVSYARALGCLDLSKKRSLFDSYIVHGAMRTQLLWLCQTMPKAKILVSVRSFPSYAISQIKSRYGDVEPSPEMIKEAWEHWFHKVTDMLYLRLHYPDQFGLVTFDDIVEGSFEVQQSICQFLEVSWDPAMKRATIFGNAVRGNSWQSRVNEDEGRFYKPTTHLDVAFVPEQAEVIWSLVNKVKLEVSV